MVSRVLIPLLLICTSVCAQNVSDSAKIKLGVLDSILSETSEPLPVPASGDWLFSNSEPGQSYNDYVHRYPETFRSEKKIYLLGFGDSTQLMIRLLQDSKEYLEVYYGLQVILKTDWNIRFSSKCRRKKFGAKQLQTGCVLYGKLYKELPSDALVYMGITNIDLYPNNAFNFVFGEADIQNRVAVSSFARYGDVTDSLSYNITLKRLIKTVSHENGHGIGIEHCIAHSCNMNGSNSLEESDAQPLLLCPQCLAKTCWKTMVDPATRYLKLADFYHVHGFLKEEAQVKERAFLINDLRPFE